MPRWHYPLDPDCPRVAQFFLDMMLDPMNYSIPSDVLRDLTWDFAKRHRAKCPRCVEFGAANVEVE